MSRTLPLVFVYWLVIALFMKKLYLWAQVDGSNPIDIAAALKSGFINEIQAHCLDFQAPHAAARACSVLVSLFCFAVWAFYTWRLNRLA